jgi:hypothetical protein
LKKNVGLAADRADSSEVAASEASI